MKKGRRIRRPLQNEIDYFWLRTLSTLSINSCGLKGLAM
jgi:hypothetical protein